MTSLRELRVGFVTGVPGSGGKCPSTSNALGRLIDELHRRSRVLHVAYSVSARPQEVFDHPLPATSETFQIHPLPDMPSFACGMLHGRRCRAVIRGIEALCDVVMIQLPFSPPQALLPASKPRLYQVCADCVGVVKASRFYRGVKRAAAIGTALTVDRFQNYLFCRPHVRVVTNGSALFEHYGRPPGRAVVSASLFDAEIDSVSRRRPANGPFQILFVGHLRPEKGTDTLVEAFRRVRERHPDAELHVVGTQDLGAEGAHHELRLRLLEFQDAGALHLHGFVPFGPQLFELYADADVLALPSRSEGTPRVLNEARAFRCPVVATRVGGIPDSIEHGVDGLMVPPDDSAALADAIMRVFDDAALRRSLVAAGLVRMRERTVERFVEVLENELVRAIES